MCLCLWAEQLRLVAANGVYSGDMGGVSGADYVCYRQAREAGMRSTFRAFIAGRVQDLASIIHRPHDRRLPIVNAKVYILSHSQTRPARADIDTAWYRLHTDSILVNYKVLRL